MEVFKPDYPLFCPHWWKEDLFGKRDYSKSTENYMALWKPHVSVVAPMIKIYSNNPVVKWFCWILCGTFRKGPSTASAKSVIITAEKRKKQLPLSTERPEGRDPDCYINFFLFSVCLPRRCTLHFPLSGTWCSSASEISLCVSVEAQILWLCTCVRGRYDSRPVPVSSPFVSAFVLLKLLFLEPLTAIRFPARARKSKRPELNWKQFE